jgi:acetolactate synthase regulatory subunit
VAEFRSDLPPARRAQIGLIVAPAGTAKLLARICLLLAQRGVELRTATFSAAAVHQTLTLVVDVPATVELALLQSKLNRLIEVIDVTVQATDGPASSVIPADTSVATGG